MQGFPAEADEAAVLLLMSDLVREIVEKLNAPPFEKNLTLIGYGLRRE